MIELDDKHKVVRGERAKQLLKDTLLNQALTEMREDCYTNIRTSKAGAIDEREELCKMLKVIDNFEKRLKRHIDTGKIAQSRLDAILNKIRR